MERFKMRVAVHIILEHNNEFLLLRKYNTGYEDGKYCFPGGHVEKGEPIHKAMIREAREEIGIEIKDENLNLIHILPEAVLWMNSEFLFRRRL